MTIYWLQNTYHQCVHRPALHLTAFNSFKWSKLKWLKYKIAITDESFDFNIHDLQTIDIAKAIDFLYSFNHHLRARVHRTQLWSHCLFWSSVLHLNTVLIIFFSEEVIVFLCDDGVNVYVYQNGYYSYILNVIKNKICNFYSSTSTHDAHSKTSK